MSGIRRTTRKEPIYGEQGLRLLSLSKIASWTPERFGTSPIIWLDSFDAATLITSGSAVSQWNDKSGNGRNVSQAISSQRPTVDSNGVTFDGSDDQLIGTGPTGITNISMFMVARYVTTTAEDIPLAIGSAATSLLRSFYRNGTTQGFAAFSNDVTTSSILVDSGGAFHIFEVVLNGGSVFLWRNGNADTTQPRTISAPTPTNNGTIHLGGLSGSSTYNTNITFKEVLMLPSALSGSDREKVEGYLAWKWQLTGGLPSLHPYKLAPPMA